jgi:hypothetical protein
VPCLCAGGLGARAGRRREPGGSGPDRRGRVVRGG